ncbi:unnamed protein product [Linum trigynum]|uniref:Bifunctional inhibitor/plant lipid transfer protein/seed storage helical domain-containing protein n=1 Tax=Linum trigynum TaxID=586398 RepID=A0AAV2FJZ2_9ROSI
MASSGLRFGLVLAVAALLYTGAAAQSGCTTALISLSPCLNYVSGNTSTPSSSCCSQLGSVVSSQPQCLCQLVNGGGSSLGITINQTRALDLPSACKVQTPPVSRCNGGNSPSGSPAAGGSPPSDSSNGSPGTPAGSAPSTPSDDGGSDGGSDVPTTIGTSGASTAVGRMELPITLFMVLVASSCALL